MSSNIYKSKTILQVLPSLFSGGVERGTIEIAKALKAEGFNSIVVSSGGKMVDELTSTGTEHIVMPVNNKNPINIWYNSLKLTKLIKEKKIDIIHARSRAPAWSCILASKKSNVHFVTTFHCIYNFNNIFKKYYNSIMTKSDKVIAVSNFVKKHIIENYHISGNKITTIHRGVNHQYFSPNNVSDKDISLFKKKYNINEKKPIILMPSRFTRWKGHEVLIHALSKINNQMFYCLLVGDSANHQQYLNELHQLINKYNLNNKIGIFPNEKEMDKLYAISNIIISSSLRPEAFGRTIIEGQAMEKLVIATNIGGAAETIIDGKNGFHVTPGNIDDLTKKIKKCFELLQNGKDKMITELA